MVEAVSGISLSAQSSLTAGSARTAEVTEVAEVAEIEEVTNELTDEQRRQLDELKARDREVRAHEQAHKIVGGRYTGKITYEYTTGPDGLQYAVAGEVPIDAAPEDEPAATIQKMQVVIAAALAPREPSAQDRAVARYAQKELIIAQADLRTERLTPTESGEAEFPEPIFVDQLSKSAEEGYSVVRDDEPSEAA